MKRLLRGAALVCFTALALAAALTVITTKHTERQLNMRLAQLQRERDEVDAQWTRLLLEEATLSTHTRIDAAARRDLGMVEPGPDSLAAVVP